MAHRRHFIRGARACDQRRGYQQLVAIRHGEHQRGQPGASISMTGISMQPRLGLMPPLNGSGMRTPSPAGLSADRSWPTTATATSGPTGSKLAPVDTDAARTQAAVFDINESTGQILTEGPLNHEDAGCGYGDLEMMTTTGSDMHLHGERGGWGRPRREQGRRKRALPPTTPSL